MCVRVHGQQLRYYAGAQTMPNNSAFTCVRAVPSQPHVAPCDLTLSSLSLSVLMRVTLLPGADVGTRS